jgi:hypothetical protein
MMRSYARKINSLSINLDVLPEVVIPERYVVGAITLNLDSRCLCKLLKDLFCLLCLPCREGHLILQIDILAGVIDENCSSMIFVLLWFLSFCVR